MVGDIEYIKRELADQPQNLDYCDQQGNSLLQLAAKNGHYGIVRLLIDEGCDIHGMNVDKETPLVDAAINGHLEVVRLLLEAGVDPLKLNVTDHEPFDLVKGESKRAKAIRAALAEGTRKWACKPDPPPRQPHAEHMSPLEKLPPDDWLNTQNRADHWAAR